MTVTGSKQFSPGDYDEIPDLATTQPSYCTYWEEHIFVSDHNDSPKVKNSNINQMTKYLIF